MAEVDFYLYDITYRVEGEKPVIEMYGRTDKGQQICLINDSFRPYFYAEPEKGSIAKLIEQIKGLSAEGRVMGRVVDVTAEKKKRNKEEIDVLRIEVNLPFAVPLIKEKVERLEGIRGVYEYDILFSRRYLIDHRIIPLKKVRAQAEFFNSKKRVLTARASTIEATEEDSLPPPRILSLDIETYNPEGKAINTAHPILMIALSGEGYDKVLTWKNIEGYQDYVEVVSDEAEMLTRFKEEVEKYKPDILSGYYSDGFDLPYIKERARINKVRLNIGLDNSEIAIQGRGKSALIRGITHIDVLRFVKNYLARTMDTDSYDLSSVAKELIGEKKDDVDIEKLYEAWDKGSSKLADFAKYNLKDAKITHILTKRILPNLIEMVKMVGMPLFDINRMGFSRLVEWFLIRNAYLNGYLCPNKPSHTETRERLSETYTGGFVYEPTPGLYNKIAVFDYRSLYPSIIVSHNISPDTLNCDCCRGEADPVPFDDKERKVWFCKKKKGFIPGLLEDIINRRVRIKEILKARDPEDKENFLIKARANSLKILANSFYGYYGFYAARWYCMECARSVTAYGRHYIKAVIKEAEEKGFRVLYSDTDSVFLLLGEKEEDEARRFIREINMKLPGMMELDYQGYYKAGVFVSTKSSSSGAKKKYALLKENNELIIRGFESIRRNWSLIGKEVQEKVLRMVLSNQKEEALNYVKDVIKMVRSGKMSINKMVITTQLQKDPEMYDSKMPHVAVAMRMKQKGMAVGHGTMIKFVITSGKEKLRDRARMVEEAENYDPDYYINNQILPSVTRIFEAVGMNMEELEEDKKQSDLKRFFG